MCCAVEIGQQAIAQTDVAQDIVVVALGIIGSTELPDFAWCLVAVESHHGTEARELRPAIVERAPVGIAHAAVTADEECTSVAVPIRQARNTQIASCGNLCGQCLPTGRDVGTPNKGTCALHTGKG